MSELLTKMSEFKCGDKVWFRDTRYVSQENKIRTGELSRVSLTEVYGHYHFNLEVKFEVEDIFHNDGRMMLAGIYLVHNEDKKTVFKSLEELQAWERQHSEK